MRTFLTNLRDVTPSYRSGLEIADLNVVRDLPLPGNCTGPEGLLLVEELLSSVDRDESLSRLRPLIILTGRDLSRPGCSALFGYADRDRQIGVVSTFRLAHPDPALTKARVENVIRHEIAHLQGWRHCRQAGCLMNPAGAPEDLDRRMVEPCSRCSGRRALASAVLQRTGAALFLVFVFGGVNLVATLLKPAPMAPFAAAVGTPELLVFNGIPLKSSSSLVDSSHVPSELNRLFLMLEPPSLTVVPKGDKEASVVSGERELLRVRHDQAAEEAGKLTFQLNELLEAKGRHSSLCTECHVERKAEVLEAALGRKWGVGPF